MAAAAWAGTPAVPLPRLLFPCPIAVCTCCIASAEANRLLLLLRGGLRSSVPLLPLPAIFLTPG